MMLTLVNLKKILNCLKKLKVYQEKNHLYKWREGVRKKSFDSLGIFDLFKLIWDIKKSKFIPKPQISPLKNLLKENKIDGSNCVYFEDIKKFTTCSSTWNHNSLYYKKRYY